MNLLLSAIPFILFFYFCYFNKNKRNIWKLNTSNPGKFAELKRLFAQNGSDLEASHFDLEEIDADPIQVIAHKASQLAENVIVEDTSLDIEGASIGINIRWLLDHMSEYKGRKAQWTVLLGFRQGSEIYIYKGSQAGTIVLPKGEGGFGFDPLFLPDGATQTLAEFKPDTINARAKAVEALIKGNIYIKHPLIEKWEGLWQKNSH
jgi:XTP/dITP diphosphohydrolase